MSYPLIVQPSPLQQLADTLEAIRQRNFEMRIARDEQRRRDAYLTLATKQQFQQVAHETELERIGRLREDRERKADELQQEQFLETQRLNREATMRAIQQTKRQAALDIIQNQPPRVFVSMDRARRAAAGDRYLPGVSQAPMSIEAAAAASQEEGTEGRQGSRIILPRNVAVDGVTYDQPVLNENAAAGGGVRTTPPGVRAGALTMWRAWQEMMAAQRRDATAGVIPAGAVAGRAIADFRIPLTGSRPGRETGTAIANRAMNPDQRRYARAALVLQHAYPTLLPHARMGTQMIEMMGEVLKNQPGETNAAVRQSNDQMIEDILRDFYVEVMGEEPPPVFQNQQQRPPVPLGPGGRVPRIRGGYQ